MNVRININRSAYGRSVLSGIMAAAREKDNCLLWLNNPNIRQEPPATVDGVIGAARPRSVKDYLGKVPVININSEPVAGTQQVCTDNDAVCKLAFDHLYEKQIRQFLYFHLSFGLSSRARLEAFGSLAKAAGCPCTVVKVDDRQAFQDGRFPIEDYLRDIPLPVGILLPRDQYAAPVYNACSELGLAIPEDVAIVSVNNSLPICTANEPQLTSIEQDAEGIGFHALELIDRLLRGERPPGEPIVVPPRQLVARGSTNRKLQRDEDVVSAIDYMLANLVEPIVLEDLLREQTLSQRVFERRFKQETGLTPMRYLRHLRLERAKLLLETTELKVVEVAERSGIPNSNHLCALFRQYFNQSPLAYRSEKGGRRGIDADGA